MNDASENQPFPGSSRPLDQLVIPVDLGRAAEIWDFVKGGTHKFRRNNDSHVAIGESFGSYGDEPECFYVPDNGELSFILPFKMDYAFKVPEDLARRLQEFFGPQITVEGTVLNFSSGAKNFTLNFSKPRALIKIKEQVKTADQFTQYLELVTNVHRALIQIYFEAANKTAYKNELVFKVPSSPHARETTDEEQFTSAGKRYDAEAGVLEPIVETGVTFDMIVGQKAAVNSAGQLANMIRHAEIYAGMGAELPKGILLFGPPGTGKTMIAKAIAQETAATFVSIDADILVGQGLVGQSEKATEKAFAEIRALSKESVVIVFIDEADKLLPSGKSGTQIHEATGNRISKTAQFIDGVKKNPNIVFVLSTNDPEDIDGRILSRMSEHIHMPLPTEAETLELLVFYITQHSKKSSLPLFAQDIDKEGLARECYKKQLSGRDVKDLMETLVRRQGDAQLKLLETAHAQKAAESSPEDKQGSILDIFRDIVSNGTNSEYAEYMVKPLSTDGILEVIKGMKTAGTSRKRYGELGFVPR